MSDEEIDDKVELSPDEVATDIRCKEMQQLAVASGRKEMLVSGFDDDNEGIVPALDPNSPGEKLLEACITGDLTIVEKILAQDPSLVHYGDADGYSALHRAAYSEQPAVLSYLLSKGANVNAQTNDLWTPLHSACNWNSYQCVRILLDNGAGINAVSAGGQAPIHNAASNANARETLIILLSHPNINIDVKNGSFDTAYDIAARSGKLASLFDLKSKELNVI